MFLAKFKSGILGFPFSGAAPMPTRLHYLKLEQKRETEGVQGNETWNISIPTLF